MLNVEWARSTERAFKTINQQSTISNQYSAFSL
jgi:hypothetical protein